MKATELMIGDWVYSTFCDKPCKVVGVEQYESEYASVKVTNVSGAKDINSLIPIPLTSEILEKNGFICDENIAKLVERDDTNNILWSAKYSFFTGMIEVVNKITDEKVKVRCYSVHELQHIFRLLEIEKTIEL